MHFTLMEASQGTLLGITRQLQESNPLFPKELTDLRFPERVGVIAGAIILIFPHRTTRVPVDPISPTQVTPSYSSIGILRTMSGLSVREDFYRFSFLYFQYLSVSSTLVVLFVLFLIKFMCLMSPLRY